MFDECNVSFTEKEVKRLAHKLKSSTKDRMKIEVAPWIKDYVTEMDDLYTDLTLEKVDDRLLSERHSKLSDYREVFPELKERSHKRFPCLKSEDDSDSDSDSEGERILFKGDPGMGKTTVSKKAAYDWAKGIFKTFTIVFFVFLKLVKPDDSLENAIIQQTPILEGLKLRQSQLTDILEIFGNKCLLILDGLDEHAGGHNGDVFNIIKRRKFCRCHVLVTSRPHSTKELEFYFKHIVKVNGFTHKEAAKFALKILRNRHLVKQAVSYNPGNFTESITLSNCPILLSFICLLVREDEIDLSDYTINTGEIYTRMIRCLYKKFTIRTNTAYQYAEFVKVITAVGKIAFHTLLTGNPLFRRGEVIEGVGPDAFDYGLLIGHEDGHMLVRDETADILITFPHRSLQEFLGAFYFIQALNKGESMHSLKDGNAEPWFMTNPLFLYFCLWLVQHSEAYFTFENLDSVRHTIEGHILKRINIPNLDLQSIAKEFPAIDIEKIIKKDDKTTLVLLGDILSKCQNVRTLRLQSIDSMDAVLMCMRKVLPSISCIMVEDMCVMRRVCDHVLIMEKHYDVFGTPQTLTLRDALAVKNILLEHMGLIGGDLSINIESNYDTDSLQILTDLNCSNIKGIHVEESRPVKFETKLKSLPLFAQLQHLSFSSIHFLPIEIRSLSEASRVGNLPCLTHLSFTYCESLRTNLSLLFRSPWPQLTHLGFEQCFLDKTDLKIIGNMQENCLPNLISMNFIDKDRLSLAVIAQLNGRFSTLQGLCLKIENIAEAMKWKPTANLAGDYFRISKSISPECLPPSPESLTLHRCVDSLQMVAANLYRENLRYLDLSYNKSIKGTLSVMLCDNFPSLKTLKLRDLQLNSEDLSCLAKASVEGRLPMLTHLDISGNTLDTTENVKSLFAYSCKWNQLLSLNVINTEFREDELHRRVRSGCLSSLQELRISGYPNQTVDVIWPHLQILGTDRLHEMTLCTIADSAEEGKFPTLRNFCLEYLVTAPLHRFKAFERLAEAKIHCHKRIKVRGFVETRCPCQSTLQI